MYSLNAVDAPRSTPCALQVLSQVPKGAKILPMRKYAKNLENQEKKEDQTLKMKDDTPKIALITMVGPIMRGYGDPNSRSAQVELRPCSMFVLFFVFVCFVLFCSSVQLCRTPIRDC